MTQNTDNLVDIDSLLSNKSEWPETSATYFIREHNNPGDGKRGLVFNSLIGKNRVPNFSSLGDGELNYHLHTANTHYGVTQVKSKDICKISCHMEKQSQQEKGEVLEATIDAFSRALQETLGNTGRVGNTTQRNFVVGDIN